MEGDNRECGHPREEVRCRKEGSGCLRVAERLDGRGYQGGTVVCGVLKGGGVGGSGTQTEGWGPSGRTQGSMS